MNSTPHVPRNGFGRAALSLTFLGAAAVLLGSVGTWVKSDLADLSVGGLDKDGPFLIVLALVVVVQAVLAMTRGVKRPLSLLLSTGAAALAAVIGFVDLSDVSSNSLGGAIETGWGLQLAAIASLVMLAGTVMLLIAARRQAGAAAPAAEPAQPA